MSEKPNEIDALVQAHLTKQAAQVDGAAGLARVQAVMRKPAVSRWRRLLRPILAGSIAAAIVLAFFGGRYLGPTSVSARELVAEVKRVHNQPLARCYLVEMKRQPESDEGKSARQVRLWTRGDRFWIEMRHSETSPPFVWGRGDDGTLWAVLDANRGVRAPIDQTPKPLQRLADLYTLNVDTLLDELLRDCTIAEEPSDGSLTRIVTAEPSTKRMRLWLEKATLEIDVEAKVLRRMVLERNILGGRQATVTFTLIETGPDSDADYRLEGHLAKPMRVYEGKIEPRVKLELVARWFGVRKDTPVRREAVKDIDGKVQTPLDMGDKKAAVLFFLLPDCPISNSYAPEIKRICAEYEAKKIATYIVHADPDVTPEQARKHAVEHGFKCPVLLDPTHVLVTATGATIAPEVAMVGPDRKVLYRGRIDDWYAGYGKRRVAPTQRDLRNALDAILAGKAVETSRTEAIGCFLPEAKK
ncbi:MAG TPA: redoxin domain-containing protein [Gemmataceae bacterium]|nr:redoxin domain-containing protein [Gemmataceae bacterium]